MKQFKLENIQCWAEKSGYSIQLVETPWFELTTMTALTNGDKSQKFCVGGLCFEVIITPQNTVNALSSGSSGVGVSAASASSGTMFIDPSMVLVTPEQGSSYHTLGGSFSGCFDFKWS
ncbi:TPA: hypothetical protein O4H64_001071 [Vibrio alginolyticus]|nr:hypothetical protein [Vibrio alginolyticus]